MIGVAIVEKGDLDRKLQSEENEVLDEEMAVRELSLSNLAAHVQGVFSTNRDAKRNSGIEARILDSLRAYNGKYSAEDLQLIKEEGGASIFMNITATKCRAAKSWIQDILTPANEKAWMFSPTPLPDLPEEMARQIEEALAREFQETAKAATQPQADTAQQSPGIPPQKESVATTTQKKISEQNRDRRELREAILEEIDTEAKFQIKIQEKQVADQLAEGKWDTAFDEFIQDFVVFPTAFMKGPIVTKKPKMSWVNGEVVVEQKVCYLNKRISPLDIYPSDNMTSLYDGDLAEHIRLSAGELQNLRGVEGYKDELIDKVLEEEQNGRYWVDDSIEWDKNDLEQRGDIFQAQKGVIHGIHFFGAVKAELLREWGMDGIEETDDNDVVEVEILMAGDEVIKAQKNTDPLKRRPYYKASYVNIPGSFWGRSLPEMMDPTQRICNSTARALATNMGMSSGPQVEIYVDRLADNGDITQMYPRKIWQAKSDAGNASGRAINFFNVPSNARELLEVYREFESRADDVTGIPRYAYGSDPKAVGASTTATGLSMMLESATKIVKDAIRNIDNGLIKPRVEYQFYQNILANDVKYTGDIHVIAKGSAALTVKAAQNIRRNEFLSITANANDQALLGPEARMAIIREVGKELGFDTNHVPSAFKVRQMQAEAEKKAAEQQPQDHGLEVARMQTESAERVSQLNAQLKDAHEQMKAQLKQMEIQSREMIEDRKLQAKAQETQANMMARMEEMQAKIQATNQEIALKLQGNTGI